MKKYDSIVGWPSLLRGVPTFASLFGLMLFVQSVIAQSGGTIAAGVTIPVRTNEQIDVTNSDGRVFSGAVDLDVRDTRGQIALPRGTYVELIVRNIAENEYLLDLESLNVNGQRMGVQAESATVTAERKEGIGTNSRTGKYVGGGAVIGAIIGAVAGGGKGAAIGGGAGAAGGAGVQVLTRGKSIVVAPESLVTFRLEQPLRTGVPDRGFSRNGNHYHSGYSTLEGNTPAYDAGLKAGRSDKVSNRPFDNRTRGLVGADLRDYQDGYERGFDETPARPSAQGSGTGSIRIGADRYISWRGPAASRVYVQTDNNPRQLFSADASGTAPAPWIAYGHKYVFTLEDRNGREIARDENDLRQGRRSR